MRARHDPNVIFYNFFLLYCIDKLNFNITLLTRCGRFLPRFVVRALTWRSSVDRSSRPAQNRTIPCETRESRDNLPPRVATVARINIYIYIYTSKSLNLAQRSQVPRPRNNRGPTFRSLWSKRDVFPLHFHPPGNCNSFATVFPSRPSDYNCRDDSRSASESCSTRTYYHSIYALHDLSRSIAIPKWSSYAQKKRKRKKGKIRK